MPKVTVKTTGPALLVIVELEAPVRLALVAGGDQDADALAAWLATLPSAADAVGAAIRDLHARGGLPRSNAWHEAVGDSDRPGG